MTAIVNRLKRLHKVFDESPIYFITACTFMRMRILANDQIHAEFRNYCNQSAVRGIKVVCYTLMPDHLHLFVRIPQRTIQLSAWMKSLKNTLSKHLRSQQLTAPHWQKGFFDHVIRSNESYAEKRHYVLNNPVRAGLAASPEDWPYGGDFTRAL